jgi:hypothetical protein
LEHFGIETPAPIAAEVSGVGWEAMKHDPTMHGRLSASGNSAVVDDMHLDAFLTEPGRHANPVVEHAIQTGAAERTALPVGVPRAGEVGRQDEGAIRHE